MRFIFDRDFDRELEIERGGPAAAGDALVSYGESDLAERCAEARAEGRAAGFEEGRAAALAQARDEMAAARQAALEALTAAVAGLAEQADAHRALLEQEAADLFARLAETLAPEAVARLAEGRLRAEMLDGLRLAVGSARVRVRLAPDSATRLAPEIARAAEPLGLSGRIEVLPDAEMAEGDGRVEWDDGFAEHSFAQLCERLSGALRAAAETGRSPAQTTEQRQ
ncbi:FliH/SctL family protein [Roseivivax sp. CAU 1761]